MTEGKRPPAAVKKAPAQAARVLISAAAVAGTIIGWALLALETRHLASGEGAAQAAPPAPADPFPPLPTLVAGGSAQPASAGSSVRRVDRPPPPPPVAVTRSSR